MRTALITIATGEAYRQYAKDMFDSANNHIRNIHHVVFTDKPEEFKGGHVFYTEPKGYPNETLYRYHTFLGQREFLMGFDFLFYCDADMMWVGDPDLQLREGLYATLHPGYVDKCGTPEARPASTAYCQDNFAYYAGGFQGGSSWDYLCAAQTIADRVKEDSDNNITAVWHDESHWNRYISDVEHLMPRMVHQLTPSYCYPEDYDGRYGWDPSEYRPILVALEKRKRGNHPRFQ